MDKSLNPARLPDEAFDDYKKRRKLGNQMVESYCKEVPNSTWLSRAMGTFRTKDFVGRSNSGVTNTTPDLISITYDEEIK